MEILHFEELSQPYSKSVASCVGLIIRLLAAGWVSSFLLPEPVQGPKKPPAIRSNDDSGTGDPRTYRTKLA